METNRREHVGRHVWVAMTSPRRFRATGRLRERRHAAVSTHPGRGLADTRPRRRWRAQPPLAPRLAERSRGSRTPWTSGLGPGDGQAALRDPVLAPGPMLPAEGCGRSLTMRDDQTPDGRRRWRLRAFAPREENCDHLSGPPPPERHARTPCAATYEQPRRPVSSLSKPRSGRGSPTLARAAGGARPAPCVRARGARGRCRLARAAPECDASPRDCVSRLARSPGTRARTPPPRGGLSRCVGALAKTRVIRPPLLHERGSRRKPPPGRAASRNAAKAHPSSSP